VCPKQRPPSTDPSRAIRVCDGSGIPAVLDHLRRSRSVYYDVNKRPTKSKAVHEPKQSFLVKIPNPRPGLVDQVGSFADAKRRLGSVSAPRREPAAAPAQALATQTECDRIRAKAEATLQRQIDHALAVKWAERFAERRSPQR
jgi:hypothetical protein